jgi:hypothetical protein
MNHPPEPALYRRAACHVPAPRTPAAEAACRVVRGCQSHGSALGLAVALRATWQRPVAHTMSTARRCPSSALTRQSQAYSAKTWRAPPPADLAHHVGGVPARVVCQRYGSLLASTRRSLRSR